MLIILGEIIAYIVHNDLCHTAYFIAFFLLADCRADGSCFAAASMLAIHLSHVCCPQCRGLSQYKRKHAHCIFFITFTGATVARSSSLPSASESGNTEQSLDWIAVTGMSPRKGFLMANGFLHLFVNVPKQCAN
jgi:hypothetical protein